MLILTIRTDNPIAELGIFRGGQEIAYVKWEAHRQLAETIHRTMANMLGAQGIQLKDINGVVVFEGPGSFTGLRIGIAVANALAYALNIPITGEQGDEHWIKDGMQHLASKQHLGSVTPFYGAPVHITPHKK
jgi:tRNA threonylcarbamoyladenosine biosynthesis protein TsaB